MGFLPDSARANVEASGGGYLNPSKIQSGSQVRFRLLVKEPLCFWEVWGEDMAGGGVKPFRFAEEPAPEDIDVELGDYTRRPGRDGKGLEPVKFAIAIPVWNYDTAKIEILQLSQKGLIRELDQISQQEDFADILATDFTLGREGAGLSTEYSLRPCPQRTKETATITDALQDAIKSGFDITRLLDGGNPFKKEG